MLLITTHINTISEQEEEDLGVSRLLFSVDGFTEAEEVASHLGGTLINAVCCVCFMDGLSRVAGVGPVVGPGSACPALVACMLQCVLKGLQPFLDVGPLTFWLVWCTGSVLYGRRGEVGAVCPGCHPGLGSGNSFCSLVASVLLCL